MFGKLHKSWSSGHVYMLVAVDKFTKWIEAALVTTQDSTAAVNFIKSMMFRFGVLHNIITDNEQILHPKSSKITAKSWASN
jgi:transposase-like protein